MPLTALSAGAALALGPYPVLRAVLAAVAVIAATLVQLWAAGIWTGAQAQSREHLADVLIQTTPTPLCVADVQSLTLLRVSEQFSQLLGMRPDELEGQAISVLVPEWRNPTYEHAQEQLAGGGRLELREVPICAKDGTVLWFDLYGRVVECEGRPLAIVALTHMTERRTMEEAVLQRSEELRRTNQDLTEHISRLAESEARHRALFAQAMDAVLVVDGATGLIRDANPRSEELTGSSLEGLKGQPIAHLEVPGSPGFKDIAAQAAGTHGVFCSEMRLRRRDGAVIYVDLAGGEVVYGEERLLMLSLREVSDRRRMREALERTNRELNRQHHELERVNARLAQVSDVKTQYLANVSHEIRTPLNAINGFAELLADESYGDLTDQQRSFVKDIIEAAEHLLQLINDVIDLAKVEAGRIQIDAVPATMNRVVEQAVRVLRGTARNKTVSLRVTTDPTDPVGLVDERRTKQVLFNLLTNAVRFAPEGTSVDLTVASVDADWIKVSVSDQGAGIDPGDHERIFEEFVRVGQTADHPGGAGLGLPLSRKLVELQGGQLGVTSAPGAGSTFWFTVPVAIPPEEEASRAAVALTDAKPSSYLRAN